MEKRRFIEQATGKEYVHKAVWLVAKRQVEHGANHPKGAQLDHLVALVFASHALEGYANFLGEKIAPDQWREERTLFKDAGIEGKLIALHGHCGLPSFEKGQRRWPTIVELKRLRDRIAHPRTITVTETIEYAKGKKPPLFAKGWMDGVVTSHKALRALEDVKAIADRLHNIAMARISQCRAPTGRALDGIVRAEQKSRPEGGIRLMGACQSHSSINKAPSSQGRQPYDRRTLPPKLRAAAGGSILYRVAGAELQRAPLAPPEAQPRPLTTSQC